MDPFRADSHSRNVAGVYTIEVVLATEIFLGQKGMEVLLAYVQSKRGPTAGSIDYLLGTR